MQNLDTFMYFHMFVMNALLLWSIIITDDGKKNSVPGWFAVRRKSVVQKNKLIQADFKKLFFKTLWL